MIRASVSPCEANPPLSVHANAVLAPAITDQPLKAVPRRDPKVLDIARGMENLQLAQHHTLNRRVNRLRELLVPDALGGLVTE